MSGKARLERMEMEQFARYWAELLQAVPEARRKAVEAMGDAVRRELNIQIQTADLESGAKGLSGPGRQRGWAAEADTQWSRRQEEP